MLETMDKTAGKAIEPHLRKFERFEKEKGRLQEQALMETRQRALQKFVDSLKARARIEIQAKILEEG